VEERGASRSVLYVVLAVILIAFLVWTLVLARDDGDRSRNGNGLDPNGNNNGEAPPADPPPEDGNTAVGARLNRAPG
jgi:hypothetical protein